MKKLLTFRKKLYLLLGIATLFACSDDNKEIPAPKPVEPDKAKIELNLTDVQIPRSGGTVEAIVTANQEDWTYECTEDWISVRKSGDKLILSADENASSLRKEATVVVTVVGEGADNTASDSIHILQNDAALVIEIEVPDGAMMYAPVMGTVNCQIDWGDDTVDQIKGTFDGLFVPQPSHIYERGGVYQIRISGDMSKMEIGLNFDDTKTAYVTSVIQWGNTGLTSMFKALYRCANLTSIPGDTDDSFTEVTDFSDAFSGCKSLLEIPADLFVNGSKITTLSFCFEDSGLKTIPAGLLDNCTAAMSFTMTFSGCPLIALPDELFSKCVSAETFSSLFFNCQLLQSIPENLFKGCTKTAKFSYVFQLCSSLTDVPDGLFRTCAGAKDFGGAFSSCYSLETVPENLFADNPLVGSFIYCFMDCTSLKAIPAGLFDGNRAVTQFQGTFRGCMQVSGESPYTLFGAEKVHLYERSKNTGEFAAPVDFVYCFSDCTKLSDYSSMEENYPDWSRTFIR